MVRRAMDWVVDLQTPRGEIAWERDAAGVPGEFALLSGCASILQGLRCAIALAEIAGQAQPDWELAADQLAHVVARHPEAFADKSRWAMDWYYPVLCGALRGFAAAGHLAAGWDTFVVPGLGVRCVSDQPWVTVAETCELVLALEACGKRAEALDLLESVQGQRHSDGSYWTGWQFVNEDHFPNERSSWTSAAVILAADALHGFSSGAGIFRDVPSVSAIRPAAAPAKASGSGKADGPGQASASGGADASRGASGSSVADLPGGADGTDGADASGKANASSRANAPDGANGSSGASAPGRTDGSGRANTSGGTGSSSRTNGSSEANASGGTGSSSRTNGSSEANASGGAGGPAGADRSGGANGSGKASGTGLGSQAGAIAAPRADTWNAFAHGAEVADDDWFVTDPYPSADPAACGCSPAPATRFR
jgi:hypothetical protein